MKEISLLLRPEMARAYALGLKTQTRRLITRLRGIGSITDFGPSTMPTDHASGYFSTFDWEFRDKRKLWHDVDTDRLLEMCPYGGPDDRLRLLTTWAVSQVWNDLKPKELPDEAIIWSYFDVKNPEKPIGYGKLRQGRFLPKRFRHFMPAPLITDMRVERVQDISEEDAQREGVIAPSLFCRQLFGGLWDTIHGPGAWENNDWVWVPEFEPPGGQ